MLYNREEEYVFAFTELFLSFFVFLGGAEVKESKFQSDLIKELTCIFEECRHCGKCKGYEILKNDATYRQGVSDLLILYNDKWAMLECKRSEDASKRPNQEYYVDKYNNMSYARFVSPENKEEIINELQQTFGI